MGKITKTDILFSSNLGSIHYEGLDSIEVFKITALENLTLSFSNNLEYNNGTNSYWSFYEANTEIELSSGNSIVFKGSLIPFMNNGIGTFTVSGDFEVSGRLLALINHNYMRPYSFKDLFKNCTTLIDASNLIMPKHTEVGCYEGMFYGCSSLTDSPILRAETLSEDCYKDMFYGCTSLNHIICYNVSDISEYVNQNWISGVAGSGTFELNYLGTWNNTNKASHIPSGWIINDEYGYPWENEYLQFDVLTDGTILWKGTGNNEIYSVLTISYSKDNGTTWTDITATSEGTEINVLTGDKVLIKGNNSRYAWNNTKYSAFTGGTATYNAKGNIMSLIYGDNFIGQTTLTEEHALSQVFNGSNIVSAEYLILPATTLTTDCYRATFAHSHLLTKSPKILPATTLSTECYYYMFDDCVSMTTHPELPAETLVYHCYHGLFHGCVSLNYITCLVQNIINDSLFAFLWDNTLGSINVVFPTGVFIKHVNATWPKAGGNSATGIPSTWLIKNYKEYYDI